MIMGIFLWYEYRIFFKDKITRRNESENITNIFPAMEYPLG